VRLAGQLYDPDVQLIYNRMRWYDARTGHYVSPDPTSLDGGVALRRYVSNPTVQIDPMGEAGFCAFQEKPSRIALAPAALRLCIRALAEKMGTGSSGCRAFNFSVMAEPGST